MIIWKPCPLNPQYKIANIGLCKTPRGHICKFSMDNYHKTPDVCIKDVRSFKEAKYRNLPISKLVGLAFFGTSSVVHIDRNFWNNFVINLTTDPTKVHYLQQPPRGFKQIPNHKNYFINRKGSIWAAPRLRKMGSAHWQTRGNKFLSPASDVYGYRRCALNGKSYLIHRLVAETFIPNPHHYPEINHINRVKSDNRVSNLEWCSHTYNLNYSGRRKEAVRSTYKANTHEVALFKVKGNKFVGIFPNLYMCSQYIKMATESSAKYISIRDALRRSCLYKNHSVHGYFGRLLN